ncbi:MAG: hypothetical protein Q9220_005220 [cf. Caloplaca sp. 1 TL-2023]
MSSIQRCLRPPTRFIYPRSKAAAASYLRFYSAAQAVAKDEVPPGNTTEITTPISLTRTESLLRSGQELYPRLPKGRGSFTVSCREFLDRFKYLKKEQTSANGEYGIYGRVKSIRVAGNGLAFLDLVQERHMVQGLCVLQTIDPSGSSTSSFREFCRKARRGDIYGIKGKPHRTRSGQLSILATELPQLHSPCLHDYPTELQDKESRVRNRHVDLQVNQKAAQILQLKSETIARIRTFLTGRGYLEVQTPILANAAGGATARAFNTKAIEFLDRHIELRTAPELWLKRLVLGGLERIFEIGPCFRNEGLDRTHNPEFTSCEFYAAYHSLENLINISERLLSVLIKHTNALISERLDAIPPCSINPAPPFRRLDFIKDIESAMGLKFPDLRTPNVEAAIVNMFRVRDIRLPSSLSLPRLLDRLSSHYLEPLCKNPTWIINHPECLSPLSKSFTDQDTQQRISARAELFIDGKEVMNTYEEENSPFEQRRKFEEQLKYRDDQNHTDVDEDYLKALEWGLPPTGGWGCGIDRLVMLLSGTDRINDVLPFGNLRNVVALGKGSRDVVRYKATDRPRKTTTAP